MLRDYAGELPDFEDEEALFGAFAYVAAHPHRYRALGFSLSWPRLYLAPKLVLEYASEWSIGFYEVLAPAVEAMENDHALAATVLYRELISDILIKGCSQAYKHAARYNVTLAVLSTDDFASHGPLIIAPMSTLSRKRTAANESFGALRTFKERTSR